MYYVKDNESGRVFRVIDPDTWKGCTLLTKKEGETTMRKQCADELRAWLKPGCTVYTSLRSVSKSGMSRKIRCYIVREGRQPDITWHVAIVIGDRYAEGNMTVNGCGMDIGFHAVYRLGCALWPNGTRKPHGMRNGEPDRDGGYALKQEWL